MALVHLNFQSKYLSGNTDVNIILPDLPRGGSPKRFYTPEKKYPVLWLLHGTFGDYTDWLRKTNIELYAAEKNLVVVMPSAQNTDYANWTDFGLGYHAFDYLTEELMPLIYGWFPASDKRKDNFIAGLSMGGRGALMYAYAHPTKFSAVYSISCVPQDMREDAAEAAQDTASPLDPWVALSIARTRTRLKNAGGLEAYLSSPQNTWDQTLNIAKQEDGPKLYFSCGTEDTVMYQKFKKFRAYADEVGLNAEFFEGNGFDHEWRYWDICVQDAISKFIPDDVQAGNMF